MRYVYVGLLLMFSIMINKVKAETMSLRVATFNVSMEASNYIESNQTVVGDELHLQLKTKSNQQIKHIAEIIQQVRPDIILLNEFDYLKTSAADVQSFLTDYLAVAQTDGKLIDYPYYFTAPVNTGVDSGFDLDKDGIASGIKGDAFGFGFFPGHYGMLVLSKYPIQTEKIRTFQNFLWKDMPDNFLTTIQDETGQPYYSEQAQQVLRLSSKSHWDIPIQAGGQVIHLLASHPTPPVFDGPEDRNGKRNHDEIRFWTDYISGQEQSAYIYDDMKKQGGFVGEHFVIAGDLNASVDEGDAYKSGIQGLLKHKLVNDGVVPASQGGKQHTPDNAYAASHTADWGMRADYVLPSTSLTCIDSGVFWPKQEDPLSRLVKDRNSSSDHRLVWLDLELNQAKYSSQFAL